MDSDATDELVIRNFAFARYREKNKVYSGTATIFGDRCE